MQPAKTFDFKEILRSLTYVFKKFDLKIKTQFFFNAARKTFLSMSIMLV
jgi:hypothetical protein